MKTSIAAIFLAAQVLFASNSEARALTTKQIQLPELPNIIPADFFTTECMALAATSTKCTCEFALSVDPVPLPANLRETVSATCKQILGGSDGSGCGKYTSDGIFDPYAYVADIGRTAQACGQSLVDLATMMVAGAVMGIAGALQPSN